MEMAGAPEKVVVQEEKGEGMGMQQDQVLVMMTTTK
jgi:hypothetical protein